MLIHNQRGRSYDSQSGVVGYKVDSFQQVSSKSPVREIPIRLKISKSKSSNRSMKTVKKSWVRGKPTTIETEYSPPKYKTPPTSHRISPKRKQPMRTKHSRNASEPVCFSSLNIKKLLSKSISKLHLDKERVAQEEFEEKREKQEKETQLKINNEVIRKRNSKHRKTESSDGIVHKIAWGVDQRPFDILYQYSQTEENQQLRRKTRSERKTAIDKGRARIGMELYRNFNVKKPKTTGTTALKTAKNSNPTILQYMKVKKKRDKTKIMTDTLKSLVMKNEREKALYDLEQKRKKVLKKPRKTTRRKCKKENTETNRLSEPRFSREKMLENITGLRTQAKLLVEECERQRENAAQKIQTWFRLIQKATTKRSIDFASEESPHTAGSPKEALWEEEIDSILEISDLYGQDLLYDLISEEETEYKEFINRDLNRNAMGSYSHCHPLQVPVRTPTPDPEIVCEHTLSPDPCEHTLFLVYNERTMITMDEGETEPDPPLAPEYAIFISTDNSKLIDEFLSKEVTKYLRIIQFNNGSPEIDPSPEFIREYIEVIFMNIPDEGEILDRINTPISLDPLKKLGTLQNTDAELFKLPMLDRILHPENSVSINEIYNANKLQSMDIYLKMLFDCLNEALNYIRPYGITGVPPLWSNKTIKILGESSLAHVLERIRNTVLTWCTIRGGTISKYPIPNEILSKIREMRLNIMMHSLLTETEGNWVDYEDEEAQIKIDLSNTLLEQLLGETARILG